MKTLIVVAIILALVGTAGLSAAGHRLSYLKDQASTISNAEAKRKAETDQQIATLQAEKNGLATEAERLQVECQKGVVAFANLSASMKKNLDQPICTQ